MNHTSVTNYEPIDDSYPLSFHDLELNAVNDWVTVWFDVGEWVYYDGPPKTRMLPCRCKDCITVVKFFDEQFPRMFKAHSLANTGIVAIELNTQRYVK